MSRNLPTLDYATPRGGRRTFGWWVTVALIVSVAFSIALICVRLIRIRVAVAAAQAQRTAAVAQALAVAQTSRGATSAPATLTEREKIDRLIQFVAESEDVIFIRNGEEHSAADAAAHLGRKYDAAKDKIRTAEQFIDRIASRSSLSGTPYRVRLPDGTERPSQEWLTTELRELERASTSAPGR